MQNQRHHFRRARVAFRLGPLSERGLRRFKDTMNATNELELPASALVKSQKKIFGPKFYTEHGQQYRIKATVRFDDECGNGHNTFSLTADIDRKLGNGRWEEDSGGCCHDEIAKHFPELAPVIKWHLVSTDGPMHYPGNVTYLAGDRDYNGRTAGERYHVLGHEEKRVVFGDFPISFEFKHRFSEFLEKIADWSQVKPVAVEHPPEQKSNYKFAPKWTISGHGCEWYQCPFDREEEAQDFIKACQQFHPRVVIFQEKYTRIGEGKARELDLARSSAVWPEATDEDLTAPDLKARLLARLPALMLEFKAAVEGLGFTY